METNKIYNIRELDTRDFNFLKIILSDLYKIAVESYIEKFYVVEKQDERCYVLNENNYYIIYKPFYDTKEQLFNKITIEFINENITYFDDENRKVFYNNEGTNLEDKKRNIASILDYQRASYYGYNGAVLYCQKDLNSNIECQTAYPYNLMDGLPILQSWIGDAPTHICYKSEKESTDFEYCTIATNLYLYFFHKVLKEKKYTIKSFLGNFNYIDEMDGFYLNMRKKLGDIYTIKDIRNLIDVWVPTKEIVNLYNRRDLELLEYEELIKNVIDYEKNRGKRARIYLKES